MYLAKNIRFLRLYHNLGQDKLAEILDKKSFTTIQKWETSVSMPQTIDVINMANLFKVSMDDLISKDLENEPIMKHEKLSEDEYDLIVKYRKLPLDAKNILADLLDSLYNTYYIQKGDSKTNYDSSKVVNMQ